METEELVSRITREVVSRLSGGKEEGGGSLARASIGPDGKKALVILTGGNSRLDEVYAQIGRISERGSSTTIYLSPSAERILGVPSVRRAAPEARIVREGELWEILEEVDVIYLPNLTLNTAAKIAHMMADDLSNTLAIFGLMKGIPVVAARDSIICCELSSNAIPASVKSRIDRITAELEALGVTLCDVGGIAGQATGTAAQAPVGSMSSATSACSQQTDDECDGCGLCVENQADTVKSLVNSGAARIGAAAGAKVGDPDMARMIDHTLLKPDATEEQVRKLCDEAKQFVFASVCVNPTHVALAARLLQGTDVMVCTVIGFPLGATTQTTKAIETRDAIANGAQEIDMVVNVGALKGGNDALVREDIAAVVAAARGKAIVKVILETALLSNEEIVKGCLLSKMAGADFVKTSTGFGPGGATVEAIALMRETVGPDMGVKASGGIKDRETAEAMVAAGASRIGASASVSIATGAGGDGKGY